MSDQHDRVLITGVTGLLGGAIALELMTKTRSTLYCLVRPRKGRTADERLRAALESSAAAYGIDLSAVDISRCVAVEGDITDLSRVGVPGGVGEVWHIAASLAFEDSRADEIAEQNVNGTQNVVELAERLGASRFNYVSTAYVAGERRGTIHEERIPESWVSNNAYESTKVAAERFVLDSCFATVRVFRPSIVIGHSVTHGATTFTGLYGFVRGLQRARNLVRESLGDLLKYRPLRLLADGDTPVNFIPVDYVARAAVGISLSSNESNIYHLANSTPPTLANSWDTVTEVLEMRRPIFVSDTAEFTLIDSKVDEQMAFYRSYMNDEKHFDVTNSEAVLGKGALECELSPDEIAKYVAWYLDRVGAM